MTINRQASRPAPPGGQAPVVQKVRLRYAKRGPVRFTSHRDFARALERALRRADIPVAFSQGFTPHPKISYASAAPTGAASEAEYLELGLRARMDPAELAAALDTALSPGLDVLEAVTVTTTDSLSERLVAARWLVELPGLEPAEVTRAVAAFEAAGEVAVERLTKQGRRRVDVRSAVVAIATETSSTPSGVGEVPCAIIDCVVRQVTPSVRPDDILSGLQVVAGLTPPVPARATRLAQGPLTAQGEIADPLAADRRGMAAERVG